VEHAVGGEEHTLAVVHERDSGPPPREQRGTGVLYALILLVPFAGTFFPWVYNTRDPELAGIPFFYWYQMLWVPLSMVVTVAVYRALRRR
jgi:hypothetical protein